MMTTSSNENQQSVPLGHYLLALKSQDHLLSLGFHSKRELERQVKSPIAPHPRTGLNVSKPSFAQSMFKITQDI